MDYLLELAKQDLDVYFVKPSTSKIKSHGTSIVVYTLSLKGKELDTPQNYFKVLCRKTKVFDKNVFIL